MAKIMGQFRHVLCEACFRHWSQDVEQEIGCMGLGFAIWEKAQNKGRNLDV